AGAESKPSISGRLCVVPGHDVCADQRPGGCRQGLYAPDRRPRDRRLTAAWAAGQPHEKERCVRTMDVRYRGIDGEFGAPATFCLKNAEEDIASLAENGRLNLRHEW